MGVRNTVNDGKCALFDSASGIAFGPVFDSEQECDDFVAFAEQVHGVDDVGQATRQELIDIYNGFVDAQADGWDPDQEADDDE